MDFDIRRNRHLWPRPHPPYLEKRLLRKLRKRFSLTNSGQKRIIVYYNLLLYIEKNPYYGGVWGALPPYIYL